jgi:hypothetical protein
LDVGLLDHRRQRLLRHSTWLQKARKIGKRESNSTFRDAGVTAMLGSVIEMGGRGDGRGVVRGS